MRQLSLRGTQSMIYLTRLNHQPVVVNSDLIKFVEDTPDTVITLVSGEKIIVTETVEQILDRIHGISSPATWFPPTAPGRPGSCHRCFD